MDNFGAVNSFVFVFLFFPTKIVIYFNCLLELISAGQTSNLITNLKKKKTQYKHQKIYVFHLHL